jgi:hypothetical protein
MAARTSRLGRMSSVHAGDHPIAEAEVGERRREPTENSSCCLARTDTRARAPTGPASRATVVQEVEHHDGQVAHGPMLTI